jgi:acyl-CoA reductase-like NAD-dependent aldehyde dehydrogenase
VDFWSIFFHVRGVVTVDRVRLIQVGLSLTEPRTCPAGDKALFFPITILDNPPYDAPYVSQENFGPLRSIIRYRTIDEAIRKANDTPYGLGASVWGRNPGHAGRGRARQLEAGTVWINQHIDPHPDVPFAGHKTSGLGVQFGPEGLRDFCNLQIIAARQ